MNMFNDINTFKLFVLVVFPGITSIMLYGLLRPRKVNWAQVPLEAAFYGFLTFTLFLPIFKHVPDYLANILYYLVFPSALTIFFYWLSGRDIFSRFFLTQSQTAWDHYFFKKHPRFVIATLKNGEKVGGYYGGDSAASCYPHGKDLYLKWTYKIDDQGNPIEVQPDTDGILISGDAYEYIEFKKSEGDTHE